MCKLETLAIAQNIECVATSSQLAAEMCAIAEEEIVEGAARRVEEFVEIHRCKFLTRA